MIASVERETQARPDSSYDRHNPVVVIVGPTAVGKTELSIPLAQALGGEIISADSRLFYRGMDIGTAKPRPEERAVVRHHLIDIADPDETVGLAEFQERAHAAIDDVHQRGLLPFLVGGTGQYVRAVVQGWRIPRVPPAPALRAELEAAARRDGLESLYSRLAALDPRAAARIDARNPRRVIRALEVCLVTGRPFSEQCGRQPPPYDVLQLGLTMERRLLYERVDRRLGTMVDRGLVEEVQSLLQKGYSWELPAMSALGYIQFKPYFEGRATLDEVMTEISRATRSLIRHQYNWFRLNDPRIAWFDVTKTDVGQIGDVVKRWLAGTRAVPEVTCSAAGLVVE